MPCKLGTRAAQRVAAPLILSTMCQAVCLRPCKADDVSTLIAEAQREFEARQYERADELLRRARDGAPSLREVEFNLGVNAEAAQHYDAAVVHYRAYASALPEAERREVAGHVAVLEQYALQLKEPKRRRMPWWVWGLIGGGVLAIGAGVAVAMSSDDSGYEDY
jgi:tetratricopeptide (TPR) repeat protein